MNYLVALDFSHSTTPVLQTVANLATRKDDKIWLIHVAEPNPAFIGYEAGPDVVRGQIAEEFKREHQEIQRQADRLREDGFDATALLIKGPVVKSILETAKKHEADIIVMGSHGHSAVYQILVGSISEGVLHKAECPVLLVPPEKSN